MARLTKKQLSRINSALSLLDRANAWIQKDSTKVCMDAHSALNSTNYYTNKDGEVVVAITKVCGSKLQFFEGAAEQLRSLIAEQF